MGVPYTVISLCRLLPARKSSVQNVTLRWNLKATYLPQRNFMRQNKHIVTDTPEPQRKLWYMYHGPNILRAVIIKKKYDELT